MTAEADSNGSRLCGTTPAVCRSIFAGRRQLRTVGDMPAQPGSQRVRGSSPLSSTLTSGNAIAGDLPPRLVVRIAPRDMPA